MWFAKYWFELAQKLLAVSDNIHLILTGSKEDAKLTNPLSHSLNSKRVHNVSGIFSICEVAALIERLDLLITPDTGSPTYSSSNENTNGCFFCCR